MSSVGLTAALASLRGAIEADTNCRLIGFAAPDGGRVRVQLHHPALLTSHVLTPDQLPPPLRPPIAAPSLAPFRNFADPSRGLDRIFDAWEVTTLAAAPLGAGAVLWAASDAGGGDQPILADALGRWADRIDTLSRETEGDDTREQYLTRVDALADSLRALGTALDVREVFGQLSAIARRVLPHDSAVIGIQLPEARRVRLYALSIPEGWRMPEVVDNPYPEAFDARWEFVVHHDMAAHPIERSTMGARLGLRSALRVPIWLDGRIQGVLDFSALNPNRYGVADVPIALRVADYVTLALSHQRLADIARQAEEVRVRAANLEMLDGLLKTLADVLDVREVFDRVSKVSEKVMTHDAMSISMPSPDRQRLIIHVTTGALGHLSTPFEMPVPKRLLFIEHWEHELIADLSVDPDFQSTPSARSGMRGMLSVPVWVEGELGAALNFFSRAPGHFTDDDVLVARRIADHIALSLSHQRLAEQARRSVELRARAANVELLGELLSTLSDGGEIEDLFDRVAVIARRVLPHDAILLPLARTGGAPARLHARTGPDVEPFPDTVSAPETPVDQNWEYDLVDDLQADADQGDAEARRRGYRAALRVPIRVDGRAAGALVFLSFTAGAYAQADVQVARRIADRVALRLARDQQTEAARRAEEAESRAAKLESRVRALTEELDARSGYRRVIGESAAWRRVLTQATQVAETETTVLLLGESGTGKEVVARLIHRASTRRAGAFVALNCAALPENLLEAELFGYERGAFTGATQSKPGQLEQASGGTLFLDEIGEMSLPAQAKFLRVLQEREFQRLGGTRVLRTDARVVAATNRDLHRAIEQGAFREDLFYRLNVFAISLPPLRERRDDVAALSDAFLAEIGRGLGRPPSGISREARRMLTEHHWPGNVRELRNILERAAILCDGGLITPDHLALVAPPRAGAGNRDRAAPPAAQAARESSTPVERETSTHAERDGFSRAADRTDHDGFIAAAGAGDLKSMERTLIDQALREARFNKSKAAKALGLTRAQLYVRMRRYGLE